MSDNFYLLGFSNFSGIGPKRLKQLLDLFNNSAKDAWFASQKDLEKLKFPKNIITNFLEFRDKFDPKNYLDYLSKKNIHYVTILDSDYPKLLKEISDAPFVLYLKGKCELLTHNLKIGVVGTRKITSYGETVTEEFVSSLVERSFIIVSGLAIGVDAKAHRVALEKSGLTIAVLGSGVDICTPSENLELYNEICKKGLVISYFPPETKANMGTFPARNKIIAALSQAVLITEGTEDSGSLITANFAKEYGRLVFAVPGPITSAYSKGANMLIKNGALAATSAEDIIKELRVKNYELSNSNETRISRSSQIIDNLTSDEKNIFSLLENESLHFNEIVRKMGRSASIVGSLLSMMEIKGIIKNDKGIYSLSS